MANESNVGAVCGASVEQEFRHLRSHWFWLLLFGLLLVVCGTAAIIFPTVTVVTTFAATMALGVILMIAGVATLVHSFWAGKWSGTMVQLLVGILYLVVGFMITDMPLQRRGHVTLFVAAFCIVMGLFRMVAALAIRFPYWGWSLLNGMITFCLA